jgi:hypothetical protein
MSIVRLTILLLLTVGLFWPVRELSADNRIVIRPDDLTSVDVTGAIVQVSIRGPKAKQLADKERHTTIEFNVPFEHAKEVFIGETRFGTNSATISFTFPTPSSAADFAALLKAAKVKILSQCDCH